MPRTRMDEAAVLVDTPVIQGRYVELDDYTVSFEAFPQDADATPVLRGLPNDPCQCPHWGMVLSGRLTLQFADHEEVYDSGDVYYAPPGHVPTVAAGTEAIEFSPTKQLRQTMGALASNLAAGGAL
jgi:hypothetical protein